MKGAELYKKKRAPYEFNYSTKQLAKESAQWKCECCDYARNLEVHHIFPVWAAIKMKFIAPAVIKHIANAMVLCGNCHDEVHESYEIDDYLADLERLIQDYSSFIITAALSY